VDGQRAPVLAGLARAQRPCQAREALLRLLELRDLGRRHLLGGDGRAETLELGAEEEGLPHLLAGERPDAEAAVWLERHEAECRQPPQRFTDRGAADRVAGRELLLPQHRPRRELAGDDCLLDEQCDLVGLRPDVVDGHGRRSYAGIVRNSTNSGASATWANSSF